jgi:hypothetical protein
MKTDRRQQQCMNSIRCSSQLFCGKVSFFNDEENVMRMLVTAGTKQALILGNKAVE